MGYEGFSPPWFYSSYSSWPNFQRHFLFYSMDEKLELTRKLIITTVLQILKEPVRIIKWMLCKKCKLRLLLESGFFNPCVGCGSSWQYTVPGCDLLHFLFI